MTLAELAGHTGAELRGSGDCVIETVADIKRAGAGSIAFVSDTRYKKYIADTGATALIVTEDLAAGCDKPLLVSAEPRLVYARIANLLFPAESWQPGVSSKALIAALFIS